jgi:hypothetical protein
MGDTEEPKKKLGASGPYIDKEDESGSNSNGSGSGNNNNNGRGSGSGNNTNRNDDAGNGGGGISEYLPPLPTASFNPRNISVYMSINEESMLTSKETLRTILRLMYYVIKTPTKDAEYRGILKIFTCIPTFWKEVKTKMLKYKACVGVMALPLVFARTDSRDVNEFPSLVDQKASMPQISAFSFLGLHYFLLKASLQPDDNIKFLAAEILDSVFFASPTIREQLASLDQKFKESRILELWVARKMLQIHKAWNMGAYSNQKAVDLYEFSFEGIITPIYRINC